MGEPGKIRSTPDDLLRHGFGPQPRFRALLAEVAGQCVGFCILFDSFSTWRGVPGVYLQDIHVDGPWQGSGLAQALITAAAADARRRGAAYLRLSVVRDNGRAQAFYSRMGIPLSADELIHAAYGADFQALADRGETV